MAVVAISLLLVLSVASVVAYHPPRQVDPSQVAEQKPFSGSLLTFYGGVIDLLSSGNFSEAFLRLNSTGLVHVPSQLLFVYSRFNALLATAGEDIQDANVSLSSAQGSLTVGDLNATRSSLSSATSSLALADITIGQLTSSVSQMASSFGLPLTSFSSQVAGLADLSQFYHSVLDALEAELEQLQNGLTSDSLQATQLTLSSSSSSVVLGQNVTLSGRLTTVGGLGISQRSVVIRSSLGGSISLTTDLFGAFSGSFPTPFVYVPSASFYAVFLPQSPDPYLASTSPVVTVTLSFYQPSIALDVQTTAYPGLGAVVSGQYGSGNASATLSVTAFGTTSAEPTDRTGRFSFTLSVPDSTDVGAQKVTVAAPADGLTGPASATGTVTVLQTPTSVSMSVPGLVLGGQALTLKGRASSNGTALAGARIMVSVAGAGENVTADDSGAFIASVDLPATISTGEVTIVVTVLPQQPWAAVASQSSTVPAVNPLTMLAPIGVVFGTVYVYRKRPERRAARAALAAKEEAPLASPEVGAAKGDWTSLHEEYYGIVSLLSDRVGLGIKLSQTLREYLAAVKALRPDVSEEFAVLTYAFEEQIYGSGVIDERIDAAMAASARIRERLA
jgi:hypothetical protein